MNQSMTSVKLFLKERMTIKNFCFVRNTAINMLLINFIYCLPGKQDGNKTEINV